VAEVLSQKTGWAKRATAHRVGDSRTLQGSRGAGSRSGLGPGAPCPPGGPRGLRPSEIATAEVGRLGPDFAKSSLLAGTAARKFWGHEQNLLGCLEMLPISSMQQETIWLCLHQVVDLSAHDGGEVLGKALVMCFCPHRIVQPFRKRAMMSPGVLSGHCSSV